MRPAIEFIRRHFSGRPIVGAEIGVYYGEHAKSMLDEIPELVKLYLVDPYIPYDERQVPIIGDVAFEAMKQNIAPYIERAIIMKHTSESAILITPDDLDFVYIDADHRYGAIARDLVSWWEKIVPGGVLAGDDFRAYASVREAVIDFAFVHGLTIQFNDNDWWVIKT